MAERLAPGGFLGAGKKSGGGGGGAADSAKGRFNFGSNGQFSAGATEAIIWEEMVDFTKITNASIAVALTGLLRSSVLATPTTGTVRVYVGATAPGDTTGGTVRCTLTGAFGTETGVSATGSNFANPATQRLVQITLQDSSVADLTYFRGFSGGIG